MLRGELRLDKAKTVCKVTNETSFYPRLQLNVVSMRYFYIKRKDCTSTLTSRPVEVVAMMTVWPSTVVLTTDVRRVSANVITGDASSEILPTSGPLRSLVLVVGQ